MPSFILYLRILIFEYYTTSKEKEEIETENTVGFNTADIIDPFASPRVTDIKLCS